MILDTPLNVKGPYQLRGTVDVYKKGNQWIARKWPRKPVQPNSSAQLAVRDAFKKMLAARAAMRSGEIEMWKETPQKMGKSWDDFWRSNWLKNYKKLGAPWLSYHSYWTMPKLGYLTQNAFGVVGYFLLFFTDQRDGYFTNWHPSVFGATDVLPYVPIWQQNGMLCFKGKGSLPHYVMAVPPGNPWTDAGPTNYTLNPPCPAGWNVRMWQCTTHQPAWLVRGGNYKFADWTLETTIWEFPLIKLENTMGHFTQNYIP